MTYYEILGIPPDASQPEIEAAFGEKSRLYNSGALGAPTQATETAKRVAKAYRTLRDPVLRKEYDRSLVLEDEPVRDPAITDEEFRSWLEPRRTIEQGIATKIRSERLAREKLDRESAASKRAQERGLRWLIASAVGLSPGVRQTVKTLPAVRCFSIVLPLLFASRCAAAGEAEVGNAGAQPTEE